VRQRSHQSHAPRFRNVRRPSPLHKHSIGCNVCAVPPRSLTGRVPDWNRLYSCAAGQAGYLTKHEAAEAGFSPRLVQFYVNTGKLERVGRGLLRLVHFPVSEFEELVPLWLWSARMGVFSHETALMLHDLSDALPAKCHMTVPVAWRKRRLRVPPGLVVHCNDVPEQAREWRGAVPMTKPLQTVLDCIAEHVQPDLIEQAIDQGVRRKLFRRNDVLSGAKRG
jgi:predicted transcriptional regulator of viral defense system